MSPSGFRLYWGRRKRRGKCVLARAGASWICLIVANIFLLLHTEKPLQATAGTISSFRRSTLQQQATYATRCQKSRPGVIYYTQTYSGGPVLDWPLHQLHFSIRCPSFWRAATIFCVISTRSCTALPSKNTTKSACEKCSIWLTRLYLSQTKIHFQWEQLCFLCHGVSKHSPCKIT